MKKKTKAVCILAAAIVVLLACITYLNWDNILMIKDGILTNPEELEQRKIENESGTQETLKSLGIDSIHELTEEEEKALAVGEISEEEAIDLVLERGKDEADSSVNSAQKSGASDPKSEANEQIAKLVGKMYVLKSQFVGELSALEKSTIAQYMSRSAKDRASNAVKVEIGKSALSKAQALERQCDAQVEGILSEIKSLLEKTGQDTAVVETIRDSYENEKQITKSYYISKFTK